jgi:hypothetical protein
MPGIRTKYCTQCNKEKPLDDFFKSKCSKDGRSSICKECQKSLYKKPHIAAQNSREGIDSWQQVDSVLREMAESQVVIDKEQAVCDKRIELIKKYSEETIEPYLTHKMALENMLKNFLRAELSGVKTATRKFSFGQIFWSKGKVKISLNTTLAKVRTGKP